MQGWWFISSCRVPITMLNQLNQFAPILLLGDDSHLSALGPDTLQAMVMVFLDLQKIGIFLRMTCSFVGKD